MARKKKLKIKAADKPPVVTMLGHVNHGKTSILDAIRGTRVQTGEAGGITQNVRAHRVIYKDKKGVEHKLTFIDTPGHEAFTQMRARGASVTDIAVLVVAVDDGVQPQTKEAAKYAQEAKVPIIVVLNKIDIAGVNKAKVKRDLANIGVQVEELGGDVMCVEVSAKKKKGINELLESILLVSEISGLSKTKPKKGSCEMVILESTIDRCLGPINLVLIKAGEIEVGNTLAWGKKPAKIRAIKDEFFQDIEKASDSDAVWLAGFPSQLPVGETIFAYADEKLLKQAQKEEAKIEIKEETSEETLEDELTPEFLSQILKGKENAKQSSELHLIARSENQGTLEVMLGELSKLSTDDIKLNIIHSGTGEITREDILQAKDLNGVVIGFKSCVPKRIQRIAQIEKVLVKNYEIIYTMLDEVKEVLESLRKPVEQEVEVARAQVKKVFVLTNGTKIAGSKVIKGTVLKGYSCYIERPSLKKHSRIGNGKIVSLRHAKEEIHEAGKGAECGIQIEPPIEVKKDDEVVCYKIERS